MATSEPKMDVLGQVLLSMRLLVSRIGLLDLAAPWGIHTPSMAPHTIFGNTLIEGEMWLQREGSPPIKLHPGDTVLVTKSAGHSTSSSPDAPMITLPEFIELQGLHRLSLDEPDVDPLKIRWGEGKERTRVLVIALLAQDTGPNAILSELGPTIVLRSNGVTPPWLAAAEAFLERDSRTTPGYVAEASKYVELIFTSALRQYLLTEGSDGPTWTRGLRDPRIGRAVAAIHARPAEPWTVESLAREARMSRSSFARHFAKLMGHSPVEYLITHRMELAYARLAADGAPVAHVAEELGYRSVRAFRHVFKSRFGASPARYTKRRAS